MPSEAQLLETSRDWPPEAFLDGPVPGGEDLLRRTVAKVHRQSARSARLRVTVFAVAVLTACVALFGAGVAMGTLSHTVPAQRTVAATDARTGARLVVTMTVTDDGTDMEVTVTGLPVGTACHLTVIGKDGTRMSDSSGWRIPPDAADHPIRTNVWMTESNMAELEITTSTGTNLTAHM